MTDGSIEYSRLALEEKRLEFDRDRQLRLDQIERMKIRWISGLVAVLIPLISAIAGVTVAGIEFISGKAKLELDYQSALRENALKQREQQRLFLETFAERAMNGDLRYRRDFAIYVTTIAIDPEIKKSWQDYLAFISKEIETAEFERQRLIEKSKAIEVSQNAREIERLNREIIRLTRELEGGADIRSTPLQFDQDYLIGYMSYMRNLNLRHLTPEQFLVGGAASLDPTSPAYRMNGAPPPELWSNVAKVATVLDEFVTRHGAPVQIVSAYRTPQYNSALGGAHRSQHLTGGAVDFRSEKGSPTEWAGIIRDIRTDGYFSGGVGVHDEFVHFDIRGVNTDWGGSWEVSDE